MLSPRVAGLAKAACCFGLLTLLCPAESLGMITGVRGNEPVQNMGWPAGVEKVANIKSRLGYWEGPPFGGGEYHFLYRTDAAGFNEALLRVFAEIRAPRLELVVTDGPNHSFWLDDRPNEQRATTTMPAEARVDWEMVVWCPRNWHRLFNNPRSLFSADQVERFRHPVPPPQLVLYVGGGQIRWEEVKVPAGVVVVDRRYQTKGAGTHVRVEAYDMATGRPVVGVKATVRRYQDQKWVTLATGEESERDGVVELTVVPGAGSTQVVLAAEGYALRVVPYIPSGQREERVVWELASASRLTGVVVDTDGKPVVGAEVRASKMLGLDGTGYPMPEAVSAKTGADGKFVVEGLPEGYALLTCRKEGMHQKTSIHEVYEVSDFLPSPMPREIRMEMAGTGSISGTLVDPQGQPYTGPADVCLEAAEGMVRGSWGGNTPARDGKFEYKGVPPGKYRISTNPLMMMDKEAADAQVIEVTAGQATQVKLVYRPQERRGQR